jgi:predicted metal-dependent peptidase
VLAVIDTSGSMTHEMLSRISRELAKIAAELTVLVVECDCEIQRVYAYKPIRSVEGRGGTSFCPPLEPAFLRQHRPDIIIFFTDGEGEAPEKAPPAPVIWCLTPSGQQPVKWGRMIKMEEQLHEKQ